MSFPLGSQWVFKLYPSRNGEKKYDFELLPCEDPLKVSNGHAIGWISMDFSKEETMALNDLQEMIKRNVHQR